MSPRRYTMTRKTALAAGTRARIVEATLKLHEQHGIFGTSWKDIAAEADVSVGTVYKYFPGLDQLVPACGELLMERVKPPQPDHITSILGDAEKPAERIHRVAQAVFGFYERGGRNLDSDFRERALESVREWEDHLRGMVAGFVGTALAADVPKDRPIGHLAFLFDFPTFRAMRERGIDPAEAARIVAEMTIAWLNLPGQALAPPTPQTPFPTPTPTPTQTSTGEA